MLVEKYPITLAASNDLLVRRSGYFTTYKRASPEKRQGNGWEGYEIHNSFLKRCTAN